jgi:uncharacterized protein
MTETSSNDKALSAKNVGVAKQIMSRFSMDNWFPLLHDDLVLEFPYAHSVQMPERVAGKKAAVEYLSGVMKHFTGLTFKDVVVSPMADPSTVIVEYAGGCRLATGKDYKQVYITVQKFRDGKMILFREFWNPMEVVESFGKDLHTAFA